VTDGCAFKAEKLMAESWVLERFAGPTGMRGGSKSSNQLQHPVLSTQPFSAEFHVILHAAFRRIGAFVD
jgi:hypothetical protein